MNKNSTSPWLMAILRSSKGNGVYNLAKGRVHYGDFFFHFSSFSSFFGLKELLRYKNRDTKVEYKELSNKKSTRKSYKKKSSQIFLDFCPW